jgi:hypothetical protein
MDLYCFTEITSNLYRDQENADVCIHFPTHHHTIVLN